jgi:hypothetical protein
MSAVVACALAFAVITCIRCLETEKTRARRAYRKKEKELRALTEKILFYARGVHRRFPTGDVVVGEKDLAEQLRKHPDTVAMALNVLLGERKVQKAPLNGYWKLNVD